MWKKLEREKRLDEFRKIVEEEEKAIKEVDRQKGANILQKRKDFVKRLELERREVSLNDVVLKAQEVDTLQKNQLEQEEKLAIELSLIRHQEIVDEKLRLQLRQNSIELRELEANLRAAYANKAIAAQLAEKEANKYEEELREKRAREIIEKAVGSVEEQEYADRVAEKKQKDEFRSSLQDQIIEKERIRQLEFMSFMKEKKMFDDIIQKIKEEEEREIEEKRILQQKLKKEMEQFYMAREMWKAKERLVIQEEEEKIRLINEQKEREKEEEKNKVSYKRFTKESVSYKLHEQLKKAEAEKLERESMIQSIKRFEIEEKENQKAKEETEKEIARRNEARTSYKRLLAEKSRIKTEEKEHEKRLLQQMKLKMEREDKAEKEKQEKRRQEEINNLRYNQKAMKEKAQKRAESLKLIQLMNELEEKEEKRKAELIKEERIQILKEHIPKLWGYFPKGCLRQEDYEILGLTENSLVSDPCPSGEQ